jgi:paraquat-inducible protein A
MNAIQPSTNQSPEVKLLLWLLILASILFAFGIFLPMMTLSKFFIIKNSFSVISGILELLQKGQILLFLIVSGFSIVLPILKIAVLFKLLSNMSRKSEKIKFYLKLMHDYGRWAMLDVMVVAILIVTVKLGAVASIQVHSGLYVFGSAVLLIMLITHRVVKLSNQDQS